MHNRRKGNYCIYQLLHAQVHLCVCVCVNVCSTEGCSTPNRCHYFLLSSPHLSMTAEVFLLFCLCFERVREKEKGRERGGEVCVCVCLCVGGCFTKWPLKKFQILSSAFWLAGKLWKVLFSTQTCGTTKLRCIECHTVMGMGGVGAKNTSSRFAEEQHFDSGRRSTRLEQVDRPG